MLCYFKRHNKILPLTVISCISKYIQTSDVKNIIKIETLFPSDIKEIDNKIYIKGNIILLRLDKNKLTKNNFVQFNFKYKNTFDDKNNEILSLYNFDKVENNDYFSDDKIKEVLGLYYFAKFSRILMKYCNKNINKNSKYVINIIDENK